MNISKKMKRLNEDKEEEKKTERKERPTEEKASMLDQTPSQNVDDAISTITGGLNAKQRKNQRKKQKKKEKKARARGEELFSNNQDTTPQQTRDASPAFPVLSPLDLNKVSNANA